MDDTVKPSSPTKKRTQDKNKDALIKMGANKLAGWEDVEEAH